MLVLFVLTACTPTVKPGGNNPPDHEANIPGPWKDAPKPEALPQEQANVLQSTGEKIFGIKWNKKLIAVKDRGFEVITDSVNTLSYRPAGNAYFVQTGKAGLSGKSAFQGTDTQLIDRSKVLLSMLKINSGEIEETRVLQQYVTEGERDPVTGKMDVSPPRKDRRSILVTRSVEGIPILNSRLLLDLDGKGNIAALELSWPSIKSKTMEEAIRYNKILSSGFNPPEMKGAKIESTAAVILHSPAASFVDDQVAAIRVIYAPTDKKYGMKPVAYLNADGRPVSLPRQTIEKLEKPIAKRPLKGEVR